MSLLFRYEEELLHRPLLSLGGRTGRPRPIIPVTLIGPTRIWPRYGLLDTGADDTVFPEYVARYIGIDLANAPVGGAAAVSGNRIPIRYARTMLRLITPGEQREWEAWVGYTAARLHRPLLGYAGFLQFFDVLFRGAQEQVELTVNHLYPGT